MRFPSVRLIITSIALIVFMLAAPNARAQQSAPCIEYARFQHSVNDADDPEVQRGRSEQLLESHKQALALCRKVGDARGEAYALLGIGNIDRWLGHVDRALPSLKSALASFRRIGDTGGEAMALNDIGPVYEELDRYNEALRSHQQALIMCETLRDRRCRAYALLGIGNAQGDLGRFDDARDSLEDAQQLFRQLRIDDGANRTLINLWNVGNEAAAGIQELRAAEADAENRTSLLGAMLFVSGDYIATLLDLERGSPGTYAQQAFEIHERKTAREVLKRIADSAAKQFRGVPNQEVDREKRAQGGLEAAHTKLKSLLAASPSDMRAIRAAERAVRQADADLIEIEASIADSYPDYYQLLHPQPVGLKTLQKDRTRGLRPGEVLLVYDVLPAQSALWVIDQSHIQLFALPGGDELDRGVSALRRHVYDVLGASRDDFERTIARDLQPSEFATDSYALYRKLFPDAVAKAVKNARSVIIAPSGPLYLLAFETLVTKDPATTTPGRPNYLLDDVPDGISYVPSASLLTLVRGVRDRSSAQRKTLLAFANPTYPAAPAARRGLTTYAAVRSAIRERGAPGGNVADAALAQIPMLPGTGIEARATFEQLHVTIDKGNLVEGDSASRDEVRKQSADGTLKSFQYILFAAHAVLPNQIAGVKSPSIILAHPERGVDYGFLTMADVLNLSLNADFVALSACNTGVETTPTADGISGLTRAFLFAGTPSISVTLWPVDDTAAPRIIPPFLAAMKAGATPAVSLRLAKLALIDSSEPRFRHPYAWGPSVIFGDGDTNYANR